MKQVGFIPFLIASFYLLQAQDTVKYNYSIADKKRIIIGFEFGINDFYLNVKMNKNTNISGIKIKSKSLAGFNIGITGNFRLSNMFDICIIPELTFKDAEIYYTSPFYPGNPNYLGEWTYLNIPVLMKFKLVRMKNLRPYFLCGINYQKFINVNQSIPTNPIINMIELKDYEFNPEIGSGLNIYFKYFRLSPELRFSFGLFNLLRKNKSTNKGDISKINSRMISLNFKFD
jgi:hypothetical protein